VSARHAPNAARMRQIKASLVRRDGMACFYCATPFADAAEATVDHLVPQSLVPGWRLANLVLACPLCNAAKGDTLPQAFLRPSGYGPGLVPISGAGYPGAHSGAPAPWALAGAA
jgi:5-methylcytosine-specific restriction endonuclease McrA